VTAIHCSECGSLFLDDEHLNSPEFRECSGCGSMIRVRIFPAYFRKGTATKTESAVEGESSCFFHPKKQAVVPCDECGRFLCALCRVEFGSRNICPGCISSGKQKGNLPVLETSRKRHDSIALAVSVLPVFLVWPTPITAPIALYLSASHWNDPAGIVPRSRWRLAVAFTLALLQIVGWISLILYVVANRRILSR
jgi:hypothetical protein